MKEICAQIERPLQAGLKINHLDSHFHLHTLPCFYKLFIAAAKKYNLKLRLAQTYNEGSYLKFMYRRYINLKMKNGGLNYSDRFETVEHYLNNRMLVSDNSTVEIMLHPDVTTEGNLTDHYDSKTMIDWLDFLKQS